MLTPFTPADYLETVFELEREYGIDQCYSDYKLSIELPEILTDPEQLLFMYLVMLRFQRAVRDYGELLRSSLETLDPDYYRQFVESSVTTYCALLNSVDGDNQ